MDRISEKKRIKINRECPDFPIYLTWLNKLGGKSFWLFGKKSIYTTKTKSNNEYERVVSDLANSQSNMGITSKSVERTITVGANVDLSDMDGLTGLFESPKVKLLTNPTTWVTDGCKWHGVLIKDGSMVIRKIGKQRYNVDFDIKLPNMYVQSE